MEKCYAVVYTALGETGSTILAVFTDEAKASALAAKKNATRGEAVGMCGHMYGWDVEEVPLNPPDELL